MRFKISSSRPKFARLGRAIALVAIAALSIFKIAPASAENISFPTDAGAVDVTKSPYNAVPNDGVDDTAAIQQAIRDNVNKMRILYFPNGTYNISSTLSWKAGDGNYYPYLSFQGQSRNGVIFKLKDNCAGFDNAANLTGVIDTGSVGDWGGNTGFGNNLRNFTVDVGTGNPGAIGLLYVGNNQGMINDVLLKASNGSGSTGLYCKGIPGPFFIKNLEVQGFSTGINASHDGTQYYITMEHIKLSGQTTQGIFLNGMPIAVRDLQSTNSVPAIVNNRYEGQIVLLDSNLSGGSSSQNAINYACPVLLRNVSSSGYAATANNTSDSSKLLGTVNEYASSTHSLWSSSNKTLNLPIEEAPVFNDENLSNWVKVDTSSDDITQALRNAIQAANDAGKTTVYIPHTGTRARFQITSTVRVWGTVRRITAMGQQLQAGGSIMDTDGAVVFRVEDLTGADFTFDNVSNMEKGGTSKKYYWFNQNTTKPLILRSIAATKGGLYTNSTSGGKLYLEDISASGFNITGPQKVWARQWNPEVRDAEAGYFTIEGYNTRIINDGATVWIMGLKNEGSPVQVWSRNGAKTELLGGLFYPVGSVDDATQPCFVIQDSTASLTYVTEAGPPANDYTTQIRETRSGVTRTLYGGYSSSTPKALKRGGGGSHVTLFSTLPAAVTGTGTGLKGEYYGDKNLSTLVKTQTDSQVNFDWGSGQPKNTDGSTMSSVGPDNFSVRWTGQVQAMETGTYTFTTNSDDGVRLWIDTTIGTPLIDKWIDQSPTSWSGTASLIAGQKYNIKMEYYENTGGACAKLYWTGPAGSPTIVPQSQLYPTLASVNRATGGTATASSAPVAAETAPKAFDGSTDTKWLGNFTSSGAWLGYEFADGAAYAVNSYQVSSANDDYGRDPKAWQLQGSNDGTTWQTLDSRSGQTFSGRFVTNSYTFSNTTPYKRYRLLISANSGSVETGFGGSGLVQLSELKLFSP